jgi:hypothetical protein
MFLFATVPRRVLALCAQNGPGITPPPPPPLVFLFLHPLTACFRQMEGRWPTIRATAQAPETRLSTFPSTRQEVLQRAVPEKHIAASCRAAQRAEATVVGPHGQLDRSIAFFPFGAYGYRP